VRWSLHPTMTNSEIDLMISALKDIIENIEIYQNEYNHVKRSNIFRHKNANSITDVMESWFTVEE
jgi:hypothetical protein